MMEGGSTAGREPGAAGVGAPAALPDGSSSAATPAGLSPVDVCWSNTAAAYACGDLPIASHCTKEHEGARADIALLSRALPAWYPLRGLAPPTHH